MDRNHVRLFVDIGMAITFILVTITGIFKFPGIRENLGSVYEVIPMGTMAAIHDWSGITMAALVLIHLIINWAWIKSWFIKDEDEND